MLKGISQHNLLVLRDKLLGLCKSRAQMGWVVFRTKIARIPRLSLFCGALASFIIWFFIPLTLLTLFFLPLGLLVGLWVSRLYEVYFRHLSRRSSQSSSLASR